MSTAIVNWAPHWIVVDSHFTPTKPDSAIEHIETMNVLRVQPLSTFGTPVEIVRLFGGKEQYEQAVRDLESALYAAI